MKSGLIEGQTMTTSQQQALVELKEQLSKRNIRIWVEQGQLKYSAPKNTMTADLKESLRLHKNQLLIDLSVNLIVEAKPELVASPDDRYKPFPMTQLQQAYWVGEHAGYAQSCTPCFFHHVKFPSLDPENLTRALHYMQHKHEVLRTRFFEDGTQAIAKPGDNLCQLKVTDLRSYEASAAVNTLESLAKIAPKQLPSLQQGPPLAAHLVQVAEHSHLLLSIRLNVIDGPSLKIIFHDLLEALFNSNENNEALDTQISQVSNGSELDSSLSFRDYALAVNQYQNQKSVDYWEKTLPTLPPAPELPTTGESPNLSSFSRLQGKLNRSQWQQLKKHAIFYGVTINAALLSLFAATIRPWSQNKDFCLNMLLNYRPFYHHEMSTLTGNCTNNTLIECSDTGSFLEQTRQLQEQLTQKVEHASVSGVSLLRQLQQKNLSDKPAVPFVFTSGVSTEQRESQFQYTDQLEIVSNHLQTPQVWLDHQVVENEGELLYFWDYVEDIFLPDIPQNIFKYYEECLHALVSEETWQRLPKANKPHDLPAIEHSVQATALSLSQLIQQRVNQTPDACALISDNDSLTYRELMVKAKNCAAYLQAVGVQPQSLVAIQIAKNETQMITIIAITLCGASWLPLDKYTPLARREHILAHSGCPFLVTELNDPSCAKRVHTQDLLNATGDYRAVHTQPEDRAYVIYTSGSTGQPKGVVTNHKAVLNTLFAINDTFNVSSSDRILALSAASFDLSIYDLWGSIAAGATLVIPPDTQYPDPVSLIQQCQRYQVTIWNSVPALLDMVLSIDTHLHSKDLDSQSMATPPLQTLRTIMLSGDWIPMKLAHKVRDEYPDALFYSLGGATEASIWSNYFPVQKIDPQWKSIPYGYALSGQQLYVLDEHKNICLQGVTGEIHIAGTGLATKYLNDPAKTEASFFVHPSGVRLYATGDLGRYRQSNGIEFLGRKDFQLKIRGYRIESGEIETQLEHIQGVKACCVFAVNHSETPYLVASYTGSALSDIEIRSSLSLLLPNYMLPDLYIHQTSLPLNSNGKIDRSQLQSLAISLLSKKPSDTSSTKLSTAHPLSSIWEKVIGHSPVGNENFFQHGGNSLLAVHLLNAIKTQFSADLTLADIFNTPTFNDLSELIEERGQ